MTFEVRPADRLAGVVGGDPPAGNHASGSGILAGMITNCGTCGIEINVKPYRIRRAASGRVFCSPRCLARDPIIIEARISGQRNAVERTCPVCGRQFKRKLAEARAVNYCSRSCSAKANMTLPGIQKGEHLSPGTQFVRGQIPENWQPVGSVRIRTHRGRQRAWVKVEEPNRWRLRAVVVWETARGPVPGGSVVHHRNRDALDDRLENLQALTRAQHLEEHRSEIQSRLP